MLIEFRFENHRSVQREQVFTLETSQGRDPEDDRARTVPGHTKPLLPVAAIYGANASGKSNVLSALGFLRDAVMDSHQAWPPTGGVPREPFAFGDSPREPSLFEVTFLIDGVRHQYGFVLGPRDVLEEWLYVWPKGRKQAWFEREEGTFKFGDFLKGENRSIEQVTRSNALFLSVAAQHQHEQLSTVHNWFRRIHTVRVVGYKERYADAMPAAAAAAMFAALAAASAASVGGPGGLVRLTELLPRLSRSRGSLDSLGSLTESEHARLRTMVSSADLGIDSYKVEASEKDPDSKRVSFRHTSNGEAVWFHPEQESAGTLAVLQIGPAVVRALRDGSILVVDELEDSLHPLLALNIVKQFNQTDANPRNAQLLFTTHDTNLLSMGGPTALRPDQVWLTEKDRRGATILYPLTDFKPRKSANIERGYLLGRYGAVPYLGPLLDWRLDDDAE